MAPLNPTSFRRPHAAPRRRTPVGVLALSLAAFVGVFATGTLPAQTPNVGWTPVRTFTPHGTQLVADLARQRLTAFGGSAPAAVVADTWEWGGSHWTPRDAARRVLPRDTGVLVYMAHRQRTVLFGGRRTDGTYLADTWEWDGSRWTAAPPGVAPPARTSAGAAYDAARQRLVLFGGSGTGTPSSLADTWEYDGLAWTPRSPANTPSARFGHRLAYDPTRQRVVMFGGVANTETWEWDGNDWTLRTPTTNPPWRYGHVMLFDAVRQRVVLFGGFGATGTLTDTWEWNGTDWQLRATASPVPYGTRDLPAAVDPWTGRAGLFGAATYWLWSAAGDAWVAHAGPTYLPGPSNTAVVCADTSRSRLVMLGGRAEGQTLTTHTWEWTGDAWDLVTGVGPSDRDGAALAFDASRSTSVLFGGTRGTARLNDTWEWQGLGWTAVATPSAPAARAYHAMAFDAQRGRIVLFGGSDFSTGPNYYGDTWTYDGTTWRLESPTVLPPARDGHAMAWDPTRQRVVMFGGAAFALLDDTWEWDGTDWSPANPATPPSPRIGAAMAFDPTRNRVVLFGGLDGTSTRGDTWEWDGVQWSAVAVVAAPIGRTGHGMAFDPTSQRLVVHGGRTCARISGLSCVPLFDTWHFGPTVVPSVLDFGVGCGGPPSPTLDTPTPYLGQPDFTVETRGTLPGAATVLGFAALPQAVALGSCTLYLQPPLIGLPAVANGFGVAHVPLALPLDPSLRGVALFVQGFALDPNGGFGGLSFTAGRRLVLGD